MAGKFLTPEEAARQLGITIDELNRLVDRKELFPIRDGASSKFKADDIERAAQELSAGTPSAAGGSGLGLDLDLDAASLALSEPGLDLGESAAGSAAPASGLSLPPATGEDTESIFAGEVDESGAPSQTVVRAGGGGGSVAFGSGTLDIEDLDIASLSLASPSGAGGTADIELTGAGPGASAISAPSLGGGALSGISDAGLSLETDVGAGSGVTGGVSGLDLDAVGSGIGTGGDALGGSLAGDAFDLGGGTTDDESASVVIATEDTGDSSFFGAAAADDSASVSFDDSMTGGDLISGEADVVVGPVGPPFSVWQVVGLVCSTLILLLAGLVVFDVVRTIRAPIGAPVSSPILNGLAETFGW